MSPALTILLITLGGAPAEGSGATEDPFTPAIARAAREALGPDARVAFRRLETLPSDADVVALGAEMHADAVVEVTWSLPDHLRATIHMERQSTGRWLDREIGFRAFDDPVERSRTVGFAIASMLPERGNRGDTRLDDAHPEVPPGAAEPPPPTTESASKATKPANPGAPAPSATARATPSSGKSEPSPPEEESQDGGAPSSHEAPLRHERSLSAVAVAALGVGDQSGSVGGALDYRNALAGPVWLRFGAGARFGFDPPAGVAARFFSGAAGIAWRGWMSANGRASLGLRLDVLVVLDQLERRSGSATTTKSKVLPGADLLGEACFFFTRGAAVVVGAGAEALFGATDVRVDGHLLTTLEPVHPVVELGLRLGFQ